jgi:hypothetical protein
MGSSTKLAPAEVEHARALDVEDHQRAEARDATAREHNLTLRGHTTPTMQFP